MKQKVLHSKYKFELIKIKAFEGCILALYSSILFSSFNCSKDSLEETI